MNVYFYLTKETRRREAKPRWRPDSLCMRGSRWKEVGGWVPDGMTGSHSHGICDAPDVCSVVLWPCPAQPGPALCPRARTSPGWSQATHCCCCCTCCSSSSSLVPRLSSSPSSATAAAWLGLALGLGFACSPLLFFVCFFFFLFCCFCNRSLRGTLLRSSQSRLVEAISSTFPPFARRRVRRKAESRSVRARLLQRSLGVCFGGKV